MAFTAISWNKLTSDASSVSITVPTGYYDMRLKYSIKGTSASEQNILFTANSVTSGYSGIMGHTDGASMAKTTLGTSLNSSAASGLMGICPGADAGKPWLCYSGVLDITAYRETGIRKNYTFYGAYENTVSSGAVKVVHGGVITNTATTVSSLQIFLASGNIKAGSTFALYGATKYGA
jgi:hypothetical protein